MNLFDINNEKTMYMEGQITTKRAGFAPVPESGLLEMLASALRMRESLDDAINDMRELLRKPMKG